jgi:hypothetical protein
VKRKSLEDTELGRMYVKLEDEGECAPLPLFFRKDVIPLRLSDRGVLRM